MLYSIVSSFWPKTFIPYFLPFYTIMYVVSPVATMTDKLRGFIERNFPRPTYLRYSLGVSDGILGEEIVTKTGVGCRSAIILNDVMRGLRGKIHQFIGLEVCCSYFKLSLTTHICL